MATSTKNDRRREARERLRAQREEAARRARLRGRLMAGGAVAAVLGVASSTTSPPSWTAPWAGRARSGR
ncbi:hypothetical protein [Streptomyces sp. NPDC001903]|uniref:hypothetical protein n=1 Tax=Streptomyces sp. NPDC001903 TaxID=3364622 RepID=UPI00368F6D97